jgi:hypothetical protein
VIPKFVGLVSTHACNHVHAVHTFHFLNDERGSFECQSTGPRSGRAASGRDFNSSNAHPSRQPIATPVSPSNTTTLAKEPHSLTSTHVHEPKPTTNPTSTDLKCLKHNPSSRRYVHLTTHPSHPPKTTQITNRKKKHSTSTSASKCNSTARAKSWARCVATTSSSTSSSTKPPRASPTTRKSAWECV